MLRPSPSRPAPTPRYSHYALGLLFLVYVLNYLDRTLLYPLFGPIKKEFHLSDFQMGLMSSTSFVIFYTVLGIPFGRLADRTSRKRLIALGLCLWSVFSGLTGFMTGFYGIFACRVLVGVGEATLGPAALSLLSDYFPPKKRATAAAIYSAGIPVGVGIALFLGGLIAQALGWRWAFYLLGFPGLLLSVAVLALREPRRGQTELAPISNAADAAPADWRVLFRFTPLRYHYLGYASCAVAGISLNMWVPTYLNKVFHIDLAHVGLYTGLAAGTGGLLGSVLGGYGADLLQRRHRGGRMLFTSLGALVSAPLWLLMLHTSSLPLFLGPYFLLSGCALLWLGPAAADVHDIAGPRLRGLGVAVYFFIVNLLGYGIAPPLIGRLNDALQVGRDPARMKVSLLICPLMCATGALCLWMGSMVLKNTPLVHYVYLAPPSPPE